MSLSFGFATARDALGKAVRDLDVLEAAIAAQDSVRVKDALYNFSVSVYHVKDWLTENTGAAYSRGEVEAFASASPSIQAFRDVANASKHRRITKYVPSTRTVTASAAPSIAPFMIAGSSPQAPFRMKVVAADGSRHEAVALGRDAIASWESFFGSHGL